MTLPELRYMSDAAERHRCLKEAKRRVYSRMFSRHRSLLFIGYIVLIASLPKRSFLELLFLVITISVIGPWIYFQLYRSRIRQCLREVIQQTTNCCPACGYNMTGNTSTNCPECGTSFEIQQRQDNSKESCEPGKS